MAAKDALGDSLGLAHWMTFVTIVSLLLLSFGLLGLFPSASRQGGLGGRLLQFGIVVSLIEWSALIIASGMRHFVIHLMQRSGLPADGSLSAADFEAAALAVPTDGGHVDVHCAVPVGDDHGGHRAVQAVRRDGHLQIDQLRPGDRRSYRTGHKFYGHERSGPGDSDAALDKQCNPLYPVDWTVYHRVWHVQGAEGVL